MNNPAVTNLVVSLGVMQIARKINFDDSQNAFYVRCSYVASQLICLAVYYYISLKIKSKNDTTKLTYIEPKAPMSQEPGAAVDTTNKDYDLAEVTKAVRGLGIGMAIMAFMHLYLKYTQPLFIQSILPIKGLYDSKIVLIHLLGRPATGDLVRPFKAAAGFMGMGEAATEEPAVAAVVEDVPAVEVKETKKEKKSK